MCSTICHINICTFNCLRFATFLSFPAESACGPSFGLTGSLSLSCPTSRGVPSSSPFSTDQVNALKGIFHEVIQEEREEAERRMQQAVVDAIHPDIERLDKAIDTERSNREESHRLLEQRVATLEVSVESTLCGICDHSI